MPVRFPLRRLAGLALMGGLMGGIATMRPARAQAQTPSSPAQTVAVKVGEYLTAWVPQLANIVAQEDLQLVTERRTRERVRSDFLFVLDPVTGRNWLTFRDVAQVNGVTRPGRDERLRKLFLEAPGSFVQRAREITLDSSTYVPVVLNPYFAVSFLQRDYQRRFQLAISDAGAEWPAGVVALTFLETARPTLLRDGASSERDAPARGTAWVERDTGRVLATEMLVRSGRRTTTVHTTFAAEDRFGILLPARMETKEPQAEAAYSNFRRFDVRTDATLKAPAN
jgi:hypothetical protein